ncbi:LPS export ABC transporter periplasmic protein LptC [Thiorhodococcus mannitoliphagus]|uniref:LPS export ABC transporter periplasmic protein LptC n=1 Tax=Thiorhodococcus mannitoliphagus TaxID=329406 RepID=A0A6P1DR72_9GAMM|nr:LPS export ABC transporter periplasmic protein LptC [Thiorhodococcus mannitoliphagus]NEX19166.1 LPS export ABC transporter periplasmic protein LptC [Thiorhodococcus mannitoliphagus]
MTRYAPHANGYGWSRRQLLLLALLGAIGLTAWWLLHTSAQETPLLGARQRLPDYVVRDFSAVETDASGRPSRKLIAQELRHFASEDVSELTQPRMELFQTEGPPWTARARTGTVFDSGERVRLSGNVQLDREGDGDYRPTHLETEQIDILRAEALAETDLPVSIRSDGDTLTAQGMRLWYNEPTRSTFHGRARIRLAPEEESQP